MIQIAIGAIVGLILLSLLFGLVERLWPSLDQKRPRLRERVELGYWFFGPLVARPLTRGAVIVAVLGLAMASGVEFDKSSIEAWLMSEDRLLQQQPFALQVLEMLVITDFVSYWMHRLFHARRTLWPFHAVHHSSTHLDWLASVRVHPINEIATRVAMALVLVGLGFAPWTLAVYAPILTLYAVFLHANVPFTWGPLRYVLASPVFHRWHHSKAPEARDTNFSGLFSFWDLAFGTFYMPPGRVPETFGVAGDPVPESLWGQLKWPFTRASRAGSDDDPGDDRPRPNTGASAPPPPSSDRQVEASRLRSNEVVENATAPADVTP